jgi:hypothetical protein
MKNLLLIITILFNLNIYSQVSTISYDSLKRETNSFYHELGIVTITLLKFKAELVLDLDGQGYEYNGLTLNFQYSTLPKLIYDLNSETNIILFDIPGSGYSPIGCMLQPASNTIKFYYDDGSMLMYSGEGVKIII